MPTNRRDTRKTDRSPDGLAFGWLTASALATALFLGALLAWPATAVTDHSPVRASTEPARMP
ncbi:MAG: hypothetical protein R3202_10805 [Candidatus Competibacterales bacterium]|nr:hypothetical protein [Candidatus Competibacterales bacterium]